MINYNYQDEYNSLNKHLEKLKNKMNIVISNDAIELIQKRLEELNKLAINNDIQNAISSFYLTYKNNLQNYYTYIGDIKKVFKDTYLAISNLLVPWLKDQKDIENKKKEEMEKKNKEMQKFSKYMSKRITKSIKKRDAKKKEEKYQKEKK